MEHTTKSLITKVKKKMIDINSIHVLKTFIKTQTLTASAKLFTSVNYSFRFTGSKIFIT